MIDPFTIKPLDSKTIIDNAKATRGRIITVEDHYYEGEGAGLPGSKVHREGRSRSRLRVCVASVSDQRKPAAAEGEGQSADRGVGREGSGGGGETLCEGSGTKL